MIIIKDWLGRGGINARFYKVGNQFFLDYAGCRVTSEIYISTNNGVVSVRPQYPDVPRRYMTTIVRLMQKQVGVNSGGIESAKPVKKSSTKSKSTKKRTSKTTKS